ncbi:hypothetical protein Lfu02_25000 [Longispora fulva]|uniref:Uncharacterized protein n=1 Tax=Longispora fulva TaxID=619741 RepID=A0A8J7KLK9_9ACTN|nr:hypothetical protein [Longispora fulva]MBG6139489.1 hypothetical protein [Longispora fulva]GIG58128.1 hypothetical protein Lfu02_25000 [Longispora fulva]
MDTFVGWVLIAGLVVFSVGAARWRLAYEGPLADSLPLIYHDRRRRAWIHGWMAAAMFVTTAGLAGFQELQAAESARVLSAMAFAVYAVGAVCMLCTLVFGLTVVPWAAARAVRAGEVPSIFPALNSWASWLYCAHMLASYTAFTVLGAAVVVSELPTWLGWLGVVLGPGCLFGLVSTRFSGPFNPPILAHLYPAAVGLALLL